MDYKTKYLKYKNKYLELKQRLNQKGAGNCFSGKCVSEKNTTSNSVSQQNENMQKTKTIKLVRVVNPEETEFLKRLFMNSIGEVIRRHGSYPFADFIKIINKYDNQNNNTNSVNELFDNQNINVTIYFFSGDSQKFENLPKNTTISELKNLLKNRLSELHKTTIKIIFDDEELKDFETIGKIYTNKNKENLESNSVSNSDEYNNDLELNVIVSPKIERIWFNDISALVKFVTKPENKELIDSSLFDVHISLDISNDNIKYLFDQLNVNSLDLRSCGFNQPIEPGVLREGLQSLNFGSSFNQPIGPGVLPSSLQTLIFRRFDQKIERGVLPEGLQTLIFDVGSRYNQTIEKGVLPSSLQTLKFSAGFNQPIGPGVLPEGLETLDLGVTFNQPIGPNVLPEGLQTLDVGLNFNQPIGPGVLPEGLQNLFFGGMFNQPIGPDVLPKGLLTLDLGSRYFNKRIEPGVLPQTLQNLRINLLNQQLEKGVLPDSLQNLIISLRYYSGQQIKIIEPDVLPKTLRTLIFDEFNQPIEPGVLPSGLLNLGFFNDFNQPIEQGVLPSSLKNLILSRNFNQRIEPGVLPPSLKSLIFEHDLNQIIEPGDLPEGLEFLHINPSDYRFTGYEYNFGANYLKERIKPDAIPLSLKIISIGNNYFLVVRNDSK